MYVSRRRTAVTSLVVIVVLALIATVDAVVVARSLSWVLAIGLWLAAVLTAVGISKMPWLWLPSAGPVG
jgi:hypothetical protein